MKNIFFLPTDQPSRLGYHFDILSSGSIDYAPNFGFDEFNTKNNYQHRPYHLYITSDEEINLGDWLIWRNNVLCDSNRSFTGVDYSECKKILLTTDKKLIADGIQTIDDEFLEWFVKNPGCEFVHAYNDRVVGYEYDNYTIIIPTEETKPHSFCEIPEEKCTMNYCDENGCQNRKRNLVETEKYPIGGYAPGSYMCECVTCKKKFMGDKRAVQCEPCAVEMMKKSRLETLEEAAANLADPNICKTDNWIAGAKWQLENMPIHIYAENTYVHIEDGTIIVEKNDHTIISYSEDDLREAFKQSRQCKIFEKDMPPVYEEFEDWFKQFKKK